MMKHGDARGRWRAGHRGGGLTVAGRRDHDLHLHGLAVGRDRSRRRLREGERPQGRGRCAHRAGAAEGARPQRARRHHREFHAERSTRLIKQGKVVPGSVVRVRPRRRRRRHQEGRAEAGHRHGRGLQADDAEGEVDRLFQERQRPDRASEDSSGSASSIRSRTRSLSRGHAGRGVRRQGRGRDRHAAVERDRAGRGRRICRAAAGRSAGISLFLRRRADDLEAAGGGARVHAFMAAPEAAVHLRKSAMEPPKG